MSELARLRLLFVCTGNTCRSPIAHVIAARALARAGWNEAETRSAGVSALPGSMASEGAIRVAAEQGLDLQGHRSSSLNEDLVDWADLILTMGVHHLVAVEEYGGQDKAAMLSAFAEGQESGQGWGVPDPFAGDIEVYRDSFRVLEKLVEAAVARLTRDSDVITPRGSDAVTGNDT